MPAISRAFTLRWTWAALGLAALTVAFAPLPPATNPAERHFVIEASQYEYTPATLRVNVGDRVTLEVVARDVVHGMYVDGYGVSAAAEPGKPVRVTFTADRPGVFRLRCSVACGPLHPFMIGRLQVGPGDGLWRAVGLAALAVVAVLVVRR